jgi:hypothetical protein
MLTHLNVQCHPQRDERAHAAPHEGQPYLILLLQPLTRAYEGLRHVIALVLSKSVLFRQTRSKTLLGI